jgi:hypothetical protein
MMKRTYVNSFDKTGKYTGIDSLRVASCALRGELFKLIFLSAIEI